MVLEYDCISDHIKRVFTVVCECMDSQYALNRCTAVVLRILLCLMVYDDLMPRMSHGVISPV